MSQVLDFKEWAGRIKKMRAPKTRQRVICCEYCMTPEICMTPPYTECAQTVTEIVPAEENNDG